MEVLVGAIVVIIIERIFFYLIFKELTKIVFLNDWQELEDEEESPDKTKTIKGFNDG